MTVENLALLDYWNIPNAFTHAVPPAPAVVSFDISWSGTPGAADRRPVTTPSGSTGEIVSCEATMQWSASNDAGFRFVSNPEGTKTAFAQLGKVANGVFA